MKLKELGVKVKMSIPEIVKKLAESGYECECCGAKFEDNDFAYLQETGQCQYCHETIEMYDYCDTPFQNKCKEIIHTISDVFKDAGFTDIYLKYHNKHSITKEECEKFIYDKILNLDEYQKYDLNEMWVMLSSRNCWCFDYNIGQIVHEQLMKIWYPEDYK